jgi:ribonuclease VapC
MIVIDASALLAITFNEPEKQAFEDIVTGAEPCAISAVNAHEVACILRARHGSAAVTRFWDFLSSNEIAIFPFDEVQLRAAAEAFHRYGKGVHSKARLNLADCAAYALARTMNAPLLFKGEDFAHTDVEVCFQ